ncbi:MAG: hypothetical protein WBW11_21270, partial [Pseudolabrys sp.]
GRSFNVLGACKDISAADQPNDRGDDEQTRCGQQPFKPPRVFCENKLRDSEKSHNGRCRWYRAGFPVAAH